MGAGPVLRHALSTDAAAVADVYLRSFDTAMPSVRRAHTDDEVRSWVRHVLLPAGGVWVADVDSCVVGMIALSAGWVEQLYVHPAWQRRGLGAALLSLGKGKEPAGLSLMTFQVNRPAQRFYERHGFVAVERTDGSANEEREPDIRYWWAGPHSASTPDG